MVNRLLAEDGKGVIVALDHGRADGVLRGMEDPGAVIEAAIEGGADGLLTTLGVLKHYRELLVGRIPVALRLDGGPSSYREDWLAYSEWKLLHSVDDALRLGAESVAVMAFVGSRVELSTLKNVAKVSGQCLRANLPLMVEALPCPGERIPDPLEPKAIADAARIAFEHGADLVKTYYPGEPEDFRLVTGGCPVPVLIAGGPRLDTPAKALQVVRGSLSAGGRGVVFGRNVWQTDQPAGMVRALRRIVHEDATVSSALAEIEGFDYVREARA
jgi:DhnA family fructose-bisphosphate aldolase class Ia